MTQDGSGAGPATPSARRPVSRTIQYKGAPLDAERGPGLGCFRLQLVVLAIAVVLTPLSVAWSWPSVVSAALLFLVIALLFVSGQTIIFLLRLVAAERRATGRRRPLASATRTVGELEDEHRDPSVTTSPPEARDEGDRAEAGPDQQGPVRQ
jgi:hypothetical protein